MRLITIATGACITAVVLAGCTPGGGGGGETVEGATFTLALNADPGNLDPHASAATGLFQVTQFAYDTLVSVDAEGTISSQLATKWEVEGDTVTLTLNEGITCSDGSPFTAEDAAANVTWITDPANESPFLGTFLPVDTVATAEGDTTIVLTLASPAPFVLNGLASMPMVCADGIVDRDLLADATLGTGPYVLSDLAQGDQYTYELRPEYAWGPGGLTAKEEGLPAKVVVKIITNETTAANLLLSGELNAATVVGADGDRLVNAKLFIAETNALIGEMWFNHAEGMPTADKTVRQAMLMALDLDQIAKVVTAGKGTSSTTFAVSDPVACPGDSVSDALPKPDPEAAAKLLSEAGWVAGADGVRSKDGLPLAVTFLQDSSSGAAGAAGAELATQAWTDLGVKVTSQTQQETALLGTLFGTGDWQVGWLPLNVSSPDQLVSFLSGPSSAEGGSNFGSVDNQDYMAGVQEATLLSGVEGCDTWLAAESNLIRDADVIPFANQVGQTFGSGAEFKTAGQLIPMTIRMLAN